MSEQKPSVGRIVQVKTATDGPWAPAIITETHEEDRISGVVFQSLPGPECAFGFKNIGQGEGLLEWRWPPRV